jgi:hypothetical protein
MKAKTTIKHDGITYKIGQDVPVAGDEAKALIEAGAVEDPKEAKEETPSESTPASEEKDAQKELEELEAKPTWSKNRLKGLAQAKGIAFEETLTRDELYEVIVKADAEKKEKATEGASNDEVGGSQPPVSTSTPKE